MLWEQLREYIEFRFRTEKYGVPYFLAESEARQSGPRKEAVGARARSGRGFKWRAPTRSVGRRPFKPQTALLHQEADRGFRTTSDSVGVETFLRSGFRRND